MGSCTSIEGVFTSRLKRTDADIRLAVNLWVSDKWAAVRKYGSITDWDTSAVTNMKELFRDKEEFNDFIGNWDVSNVTDMSYMFRGAYSFNQDISGWNVSSVADMSGMFVDAASFDQDIITQWHVCSLRDRSYIIVNATKMLARHTL